MPRGRPRANQNDALLKSAEMLGWALGGLEREIAATRERLATLTAQAARLRARVGTAGRRGGRAAASLAERAEGAAKRVRRTMSREARQRISEAMTKRWAERRKKG
jgi:hypothetical protein